MPSKNSGESVKVSTEDEHGNRLELLGNVDDPTIFVTVARAGDDEDDDRVFEVTRGDFANLYLDLVAGLKGADGDDT